jgi:phage tail tape-measure protein
MAKIVKRGRRQYRTLPTPPASHTHGEQTGAIAGEIVGATLGAAAGVPGALAGMVLGGVAGALAGKALDSEAERTHVHDEELDKEIGVSGGDMGAVQP